MISFLEEHEDCAKARKQSLFFSTILFVIFRDNLIPIVWKSIVPIKAMKNLEKSNL